MRGIEKKIQTCCFCAVMCVATAVARGDTLLELEGFEGRARPWRNTQLVSKPIHTGQRALRWDVAAHPIFDSPRFIADWRSFDEFRFWAYLQEPVEFKIPLVFPSEGGYYIIDWQLDWQGWKEHRIKLSECR